MGSNGENRLVLPLPSQKRKSNEEDQGQDQVQLGAKINAHFDIFVFF